MKIKDIVVSILKYTFVVTIIILSVGPFAWVLLSSFKSNTEILNNSLGFPSSLKISNYISAFKIAPMAQFYVNSVIVSVFATVLNIFILGASAYVMARFKFRSKKVLLAVFSFSLLIPSAALLQPLYLTVKSLGLYDKLYGLILVDTGFGLPFSLYILYSYFLTIPKELEESSYMDGAGFFKTFFRIILPISKPGISTAAILQFLGCWNEFQFAFTLTTGNKSRTLPLALYYFKSAFATDYGVMYAATVIVIIPSIIIYVLLQEQVVSGLAAGAVKS